MCCATMLDGGNAIVQTLAGLANYPLTRNTINGIGCEITGRYLPNVEAQNIDKELGLQEPGNCALSSNQYCCQVIALVCAIFLLQILGGF